jgi:hypothetical protein
VGPVLAVRSAASGQTRPPRSAAAGALLAVFGFAGVSLMLSSWRWALVQAAGKDYLIVTIIAAVVVFACVRLRQALGLSAKPQLRALALWFVFTAGVVGDVLLFANAVLDPEPTREFTTIAAGEYCGGRTSDIAVRGAPGAPALPVAGTIRVKVGGRSCRAMRDGDTVVVVIGRGYFGRPWVHEVRPVPGTRQLLR